MDMHEFWNIIVIIVAAIAAGFNFAYYLSHINGKKYIRLWIGIILSVSIVLRILLAVHVFNEDSFDEIFRPFSVLFYLAFMFGPYIDWGLPKKSLKRGK